jgi:hypothetical protein
MATATAQPAAVTLPAWVDAAALTDRQRDYLAAFLSLSGPRQSAPTLREVGEAIGVSKVTAHEFQMALIRKGVLVKGRSFRDVRLNTPAGRDRTDAAACREEASRLREMARSAAKLMRKAARRMRGQVNLRSQMRLLAEEIGGVVGNARTHRRN